MDDSQINTGQDIVAPVPPTAAPAAPTKTGTPNAQLSVGAWLGILCWPLVIAAATVIYTNKKSNERMEALIATRPDIAVVDDVQLIKLAIDNGADRYSPASVIEEIGRIVKRNGMEDTILLSKSMIMYTPESKRLNVRTAPAAAPAPTAASGELSR